MRETEYHLNEARMLLATMKAETEAGEQAGRDHRGLQGLAARPPLAGGANPDTELALQRAWVLTL
jgi:hypothetical protein